MTALELPSPQIREGEDGSNTAGFLLATAQYFQLSAVRPCPICSGPMTGRLDELDRSGSAM